MRSPFTSSMSLLPTQGFFDVVDSSCLVVKFKKEIQRFNVQPFNLKLYLEPFFQLFYVLPFYQLILKFLKLSSGRD